ncbi:hypothetical protein ISS86_02050 [Candidatus Microgenomates bacterium]|nr:hypothetical protein [Candidatus Microgenomates bacterium]
MRDPSSEVIKIAGGKGLFEIKPNPYTPRDADKIDFPKLEVKGVEIEGNGAEFVRAYVSVVRDEKGLYVVVGEGDDRDLTKMILAKMSQEGKSGNELAVRLRKAKNIKTVDVVFIPHDNGIVGEELRPTLICKGAPDFTMTARNERGRTALTTRDLREQQHQYMGEGVKREELEKLNEVTSQSGGDATKVDIIFTGSDKPFLTVKKI